MPTLTDDGKYAGTITEGDVLRAMESMCHWNISEAEKVKLMDVKRKRNIQAVTISTDMDDLVDVITDQNFVPVIVIRRNLRDRDKKRCDSVFIMTIPQISKE